MNKNEKPSRYYQLIAALLIECLVVLIVAVSFGFIAFLAER